MRPIANPPNPWLSTEVEYLEEPPDARLEVYEDHTREIIASNDSPDLGFSFSVNPYRGAAPRIAVRQTRTAMVLVKPRT